MFSVIFTIVIGVIVYVLYQWYKEWSWNKKQPRLSVPATVVAKREKNSTSHSTSSTSYSDPFHHHHHHHDPHDHGHHHHHHHFGSSGTTTRTSTTTDYFVTFELDNRQRFEFSVDEDEYGLIVEDDKGILTYQGTWFISFVRT